MKKIFTKPFIKDFCLAYVYFLQFSSKRKKKLENGEKLFSYFQGNCFN